MVAGLAFQKNGTVLSQVSKSRPGAPTKRIPPAGRGYPDWLNGALAGGITRIRSGILGGFAPMRWLMVCLLVSLVALLWAAGAMARHIWIRHAELKREPPSRVDAAPGADPEP